MHAVVPLKNKSSNTAYKRLIIIVHIYPDSCAVLRVVILKCNDTKAQNTYFFQLKQKDSGHLQ